MRVGVLSRTLAAVLAELRISAMTALQYRVSFLSEAAISLVWAAWSAQPVLVLFGDRQVINGWTAPEAMLVTGFFLMLAGLMEALIEPALQAVVQEVRDGTLDFVLLKPIDAQVQVSFRRIAPLKLLRCLMGLGVVIYGAAQLPVAPGALQWASSLLWLGFSLLVLNSVFTVVVSTSFYFVRVDNLAYLLQGALEAGRWPLAFYPTAIRVLLTFVLPIGLMTTWPALALRGALAPEALGVGLGVTAAFAILARLIWSRAILRYSSASS
jgi:ABC-2 type transport system permease protein